MTYTHIKIRRPDGKSPHMDRSLCGDVTGYYTDVSGPEEYASIREELAKDKEGFPLCPKCEQVMSATENL